MADWKNLTKPARTRLIDALRAGLKERGIDDPIIDLDRSELPGRYRLFVVADEFEKLDYSERLNMVWAVLDETWERADRLRLTLVFPLAPDETPESDESGDARESRPKQRRRRAKSG